MGSVEQGRGVRGVRRGVPAHVVAHRLPVVRQCRPGRRPGPERTAQAVRRVAAAGARGPDRRLHAPDHRQLPHRRDPTPMAARDRDAGGPRARHGDDDRRPHGADPGAEGPAGGAAPCRRPAPLLGVVGGRDRDRPGHQRGQRQEPVRDRAAQARGRPGCPTTEARTRHEHPRGDLGRSAARRRRRPPGRARLSTCSRTWPRDARGHAADARPPSLATAAVVAVVATVAAVAVDGTTGEAPQPATPIVPSTPTLGPGTNGWVAVDAYEGGGRLSRPAWPGGPPARGHRIGCRATRRVRRGRRTERDCCSAADRSSEQGSDAPSSWSSRWTGRRDRTTDRDRARRLQVAPAASTPTRAGPGPRTAGGSRFAGPARCGWSTRRPETIRRLPDLRPIDLEWRPGTDRARDRGRHGHRTGRRRRCPRRSPSTRCPPVSSAGSAPSRPRTSRGRRTARPWRTRAAKPTRRSSGSSTATAPTSGCSSPTPARRLHGIGPVWSPTGDRIVYQRLLRTRARAPRSSS